MTTKVQDAFTKWWAQEWAGAHRNTPAEITNLRMALARQAFEDGAAFAYAEVEARVKEAKE